MTYKEKESKIDNIIKYYKGLDKDTLKKVLRFHHLNIVYELSNGDLLKYDSIIKNKDFKVV